MDKQELLDSIRECEQASPEKLCALRAEIARLTAERDEWKLKAEESQGETARIVGLFRALAKKINTDGHHPFSNAIEAVCDLCEASKGGRDHG